MLLLGFSRASSSLAVRITGRRWEARLTGETGTPPRVILTSPKLAATSRIALRSALRRCTSVLVPSTTWLMAELAAA